MVNCKLKRNKKLKSCKKNSGKLNCWKKEKDPHFKGNITFTNPHKFNSVTIDINKEFIRSEGKWKYVTYFNNKIQTITTKKKAIQQANDYMKKNNKC